VDSTRQAIVPEDTQRNDIFSVPSEPVTSGPARTPWQAFQSRKHFGSLDGLRCASVVAVIWFHGPGFNLPGILGQGFLGVTLFFAISGFLITTLLIREQSRTGDISLKKFYLRRSLRIFPLYYLMLGVYCVFIFTLVHDPATAKNFRSHLPFFATYTSNWFVPTLTTFGFAWSLAAEEQFYSTWPSVVKLLRPRRALWFAICFTAIVIWSQRFATWPLHSNNFATTVLNSVPPAICFGCTFALILHTERGFRALWTIFGNRTAPLIFFAALILIIQFSPEKYLPIHLVLAALVISSVIREDHILAPILTWRWISYLGTISYGMYLTHMLVYAASKRFESRFPSWHSRDLMGFIVALLGTVLLSAALFRYYERPFLILKTRFEAAK
jgi:peptidoglycan/LPS O-acetylase OafA/YrhL